MSLYTKEGQARLMMEHHEVIREQAAYIKIHTEKGKLRDVIRHMAIMLGELRTSHLTPKVYYELYTSVLPHLLTFSSFLSNLAREGTPVAELYEGVQRTAHVLPRLYLMIAAGSVYIRTNQAPASVVMEDLLSHIKAVQHPARGLFLRAFLIQSLKDYLPPLMQDASDLPDGIDSITFLIDNLGEMNRLWVRMQQPVGIGPGRGRKRRERERQDLRQLVGANLMRLSALDGLDVNTFGERVLPRLLIEVSACKDRLSQGYLLESLLSVFPAEWHLATVDILTSTLRALVPDTALGKGVFLAIVQRIQDAVQDQTEPVIGGLAGQAGLYSSIPLPPIPFPPKIAAGLPQNIDLFAILLRNILALAEDPDGPFRVTAGLTRDDVPMPKMLHAGEVAATMNGCAAVLEVLLGLVHFSSACYNAFLPQICAVLQAAAKMTRQIIGLPALLQAESDPSSDYALNLAQTHLEHRHLPGQYVAGSSSQLSVKARSALNELLDASPHATNGQPVPNVQALLEANGLLVVQPHRALDAKCSQTLTALLNAAQELLGFETLKLLSYASALSALSYQDRKEVAFGFVTSLLSKEERINDYEDCRRLFAALAPLILNDPATAPQNAGTTAFRSTDLAKSTNSAAAAQRNFEQEQVAVAKLLLLLGSGRTANDETNAANASPDTWDNIRADFRIYQLARNSCAWGTSTRIVYSFPSVVQLTISLLKRMETLDPEALRSDNKENSALMKEVYSFLYDTIAALALAGHSEVALDLFVDAAIQIKDPGCSEELLGQAFGLYESMAHQTSLQARCLYLLLSALEVATQIQGSRFEGLLLKSVAAARRLPSAFLAVPVLLSCSYLYSRIDNPDRADAPQVLDCLRAALRIADTPLLHLSAPLYLDCVAGFLAAYERTAPGVTAKQVTDLFVLAAEHTRHFLEKRPAPGMQALAKEKQHHGALYEAMQAFRRNPNPTTEKQLQTLMSSVDCSSAADLATYFNALVLKAQRLPKDKLAAIELPEMIPDYVFIPNAPVEASNVPSPVKPAVEAVEKTEPIVPAAAVVVVVEESNPAVAEENSSDSDDDDDSEGEEDEEVAEQESEVPEAAQEAQPVARETESIAADIQEEEEQAEEAKNVAADADDSDDEDEEEEEKEVQESHTQEQVTDDMGTEMESAPVKASASEYEVASDKDDSEGPPPLNSGYVESAEPEVEKEPEVMPPIPDHYDKDANLFDPDTSSTHVPYGAPDDESA